jgi:hypothetical protein
MRSSAALGWLLLLVGSACTHPRQADDASQKATAEEGPQPAATEPAAEKDGAKATLSPSRSSGGPKDPKHVPVATSAEGLLAPGAEGKVRAKLGLPASGPGLRDGLISFQRGHDLPATGVIDHATAQALGLDPGDIFERAEPH